MIFIISFGGFMRLFLNIVSFALVACFVLGCNAKKEDIVAQVGTEKIFRSDVDLLLKSYRIFSDDPKVSRHINNYYKSIAQVLTGLKLYPGISPLVQQDMELMKNRLLTSVYQRVYAFENLFFSDKELLEFYQKDTARFAIKGKQYPFSEIRPRIAEELYLERNKKAYQEHFEEILAKAEIPSDAKVFYKIFTDSLLANAFYKTLETTENIEKIEGITLETVKNREAETILTQKPALAEIFKDSLGNRNAFLAIDFAGKKNYIALHVKSVRTGVKPIPSEFEAKAQKSFLEKIKKEIVETTGPKLVEKYKLSVVPPKPVDEKVFYEKNKEKWLTKPGLFAYYIQNKDSLLLAKALSNVKSLEEFRLVAASSKNENTQVKEKSGEIGVVLEEHSLPYGIGLFPELFNAFSKDSVGISPIFSKNGTFHAFFVTKKIKAEQKPFERVQQAVRATITNDILAADSSAPLIDSAGKTVLYEKDLMALFASLSVEEQSKLTRNHLASYLMEWFAFASEAKALHLDTTAIYKAMLRQQETYFARKYIIDSVKAIPLLSESDAKAYYEKYGKFFPERSLESLLSELSTLAKNADNDLKYEYWRSSFVDSLSYEQAFSLIYPKITKLLPERLVLRFSHQAELENPLVVKDSAFMPEKHWGMNGKQLLAFADSIYAINELDKVLWDFSLLRTLEPTNDSLYAVATFRLGQLHSDREEYDESLREYTAFVQMFPEHPLAEKALFAKGFIYDENLKQPEKALEIFELFLKKYPNSELKESVNWLVQNIKNNGKLASELLEKIGNE